jgi:hypothetical protein
VIGEQFFRVGKEENHENGGGVASDQTVTVSATYSVGESTKTAAKDVTITNTNTTPYPLMELTPQ